MARAPEGGLIYDSASLWKGECLLDDRSVFSSDALWTPAHLDELDAHFVRNADASGGTFLGKLQRQLAATSPEARRLAAELLWALSLFPLNVGREAKLRVITTVWAWSGARLDFDDPVLVGSLNRGIGNTGTAFNTYRWKELTFLITLTRQLKECDRENRQNLLSDPWRASEWVSTVPGADVRQFRHMLLHLLFPNDFEPVASAGHRRELLAAYKTKIPGGDLRLSSDPLTADDQRLRAIRDRLEAEHPGTLIHYYDSPWREQWLASDDGGSATAAGRSSEDGPEPSGNVAARRVREEVTAPRAWVIGAGEGATRWAAFRDGGHVAIGWDEVGDLRQYADQAAVQAAVKAALRREWEPTNDALACFQFCREMAVGDEVFVKQGRDRILGYGVVAGDYTHDASRPDYRNVRRVEWRNEGDWTVPEELRFPTKTLTDVTNFRALLEHLRPLVQRPRAPTPPPEVPYTTDDALAEGVFLNRAEFDRILDALRRRKNVILQGAPGVGKSFVARRLAYAAIGHKRRDAVQGVQFHQSYAYEDFVQGWRPSDKGGFTLRNGVFYEFCRRAQGRPNEPHVFVIDEINRGNLSKILGELMSLIEADKRGPEHAIPLTYSTSGDDTFHVPENLFLVGLMNTADRSLAMVDYALWRRFAFVTLEPRFAAPAFRDALRARGVDDATIDAIRARVARVDEEITADTKTLGRGFEIGHSYFVPAGPVDNPAAWYERVVAEELRPLLEEYWFDDAARMNRCVDVLLG